MFKHFIYIKSFNLLNTAEVGIVIIPINKQEAEAEWVTSAEADGIGEGRAQLISTLLWCCHFSNGCVNSWIYKPRPQDWVWNPEKSTWKSSTQKCWPTQGSNLVVSATCRKGPSSSTNLVMKVPYISFNPQATGEIVTLCISIDEKKKWVQNAEITWPKPDG